MSYREPIAQVGQVGMDALLPGVTKCFDLLDLASRIRDFPVSYSCIVCRYLPVGTKAYSVRRVNVDHLDFTAKVLLLCERGHHLKRVAEDHSVRPVRIVLVVLNRLPAGEAVEVCEQIQFGLIRGAAQVLDEHVRGDLLLNVDRRCVDGEILIVLFVFALPHQLRVERCVARVAKPRRPPCVLVEEFLGIGGRDVEPFVLVPDSIDWRGAAWQLLPWSHAQFSCSRISTVPSASTRNTVISSRSSAQAASPSRVR